MLPDESRPVSEDEERLYQADATGALHWSRRLSARHSQRHRLRSPHGEARVLPHHFSRPIRCEPNARAGASNASWSSARARAAPRQIVNARGKRQVLAGPSDGVEDAAVGKWLLVSIRPGQAEDQQRAL